MKTSVTIVNDNTNDNGVADNAVATFAPRCLLGEYIWVFCNYCNCGCHLKVNWYWLEMEMSSDEGGLSMKEKTFE